MAILDDTLTTESLADDVVEGEAELIEAPPAAESEDAAAADAGPLTLEAAVMEYFVWEEQRASRRSRQGASSGSGAKRGAFVFDAAAREAVTRFLWHFGANTLVDELSPKSMEGFQETIGANTIDPAARLQPVKEFLRFCKDRGYTVTRDADAAALNLGNFLRVKRTAAVERDSSSFQHEEAKVFEMTAAGLELLHQERKQLEAEMPMAVQAVADAREDKDIRENAPLEAAREYQERLKSRIDELTYQIDHAKVGEQRETGRAKLGSRVSVVEIDQDGDALGEAREYTLVGTTEANAATLRISVESPLGRGLLDQTANGRIEIDAPSGRKRFHLLGVSG